MTPAEWRRAEAKRRINRAMANVQRAQDELSRAAAELSSLRYGHPFQKRVMASYDHVHETWYRVNSLTVHPRVEMDRDPTAEELAAADGGTVGGAR